MSDAQTLEQKDRDEWLVELLADPIEEYGSLNAWSAECAAFLRHYGEDIQAAFRQQPLPHPVEVEYPTAFSISKRRHENKNSSAALKGGD